MITVSDRTTDPFWVLPSHSFQIIQGPQSTVLVQPNHGCRIGVKIFNQGGVIRKLSSIKVMISKDFD